MLQKRSTSELSLPKTPSIWLAVSGESEHDRCIIAIGPLFVRMLVQLAKGDVLTVSRALEVALFMDAKLDLSKVPAK